MIAGIQDEKNELADASPYAIPGVALVTCRGEAVTSRRMS
jgi:hypothetical protein